MKSAEIRNKTEGNEMLSFAEVRGIFSEIANIYVEARRAQVGALNIHKFSDGEYTWVKRRVYEAAGMHVTSNLDFSAIEDLAREGAQKPSHEISRRADDRGAAGQHQAGEAARRAAEGMDPDGGVGAQPFDSQASRFAGDLLAQGESAVPADSVSNAGMLEARSLTKYYGPLPALRDASFIAKPGQILGYLGPNGSGKSTTVRMLVGLMEPSNGDVLWRGKSIFEDLPAYRKQLGYVPEEPFLYTHLTAPEYLRLVGGLRGVEDAVLEKKIEQFLKLLGLEDDQYSTLSAFSKGMRQKVMLASALLHNPELIILDEPFSGLDVSAALMLRSVIRSLADEGRTILMSSHVIEVVEQMCTDVVILSDGIVVAHDRVDRLRGLQQDQSLEHVFVKLAVTENTEDTAKGDSRDREAVIMTRTRS